MTHAYPRSVNISVTKERWDIHISSPHSSVPTELPKSTVASICLWYWVFNLLISIWLIIKLLENFNRLENLQFNSLFLPCNIVQICSEMWWETRLINYPPCLLRWNQLVPKSSTSTQRQKHLLEKHPKRCMSLDLFAQMEGISYTNTWREDSITRKSSKVLQLSLKVNFLSFLFSFWVLNVSPLLYLFQWVSWHRPHSAVLQELFSAFWCCF